MTDPVDEFRQRLLDVQEISPALREAYRRELQTMLHPPMTLWSGLPGAVLLVLLIACVGLIVRAALFHHVSGLMLAGYAVLAVAAGVATVVALILGLRSPSDPKSLFGAFYVFVFYFACATWSLERRIASAELASREQSLRVECRLADLVQRLQK